jgi:hypothetical protein
MNDWRIRDGLVLFLLSLQPVAGMCTDRVVAESVVSNRVADELLADELLADSALALLPDSTLGFVWIRNVDGMDAKVSAFMRQFGIPLPSPMKFLKFATGLGPGIDGQHDLVVALLASDKEFETNLPVVLLPVDAYEKLAASVRGDETGEICRVTISGEDVLIARNRTHAMLMNVEHRKAMGRLLSQRPKLLQTVRPLRTWLVDQDMAIFIAPKSMDNWFALDRQVGQKQKNFGRNVEQAPMGEMIKQVRKVFDIYRNVLDATEARVETSGLGVSIDGQSNLKISAKLTLAKTSEVAQFRFAPLDRRQLITVGQSGSDVAAVAGTMPDGFGELIAKMSRRLNQRYPDLEGYGDFQRADWDKLEQSYRATCAGIQAISMVLRVPQETEPLISGFHGLLQVEDASAYLASYQQALKLNNELLKQTRSDIKMISEYSPVTIADVDGIKVVADVAAATGDQNNLFWQATLNHLFGKDGKLMMHLLAVDPTHVILSTAAQGNLVRLVGDYQAGNWQETSPQRGDSLAPTTLKLVDDHSPWIAVVSPRGSVQWLTRWMKALMGHLSESPKIPPFPPTPPIGVSFALQEGHAEVNLVLPAKTLEGFAEFIQAVE